MCRCLLLFVFDSPGVKDDYCAFTAHESVSINKALQPLPAPLREQRFDDLQSYVSENVALSGLLCNVRVLSE